jgi:hypothetical protein
MFAASTRDDGFPSSRAKGPDQTSNRIAQPIVFSMIISPVREHQAGTGIAGIQSTPLTKERIMKLQLGQNQLVLELSSSPFSWFYGQTERMSLTSLSLLFVQFSLFARQPAV